MHVRKFTRPKRKQPACDPRTPPKTERPGRAKTPDEIPTEPRWDPDARNWIAGLPRPRKDQASYKAASLESLSA